MAPSFCEDGLLALPPAAQQMPGTCLSSERSPPGSRAAAVTHVLQGFQRRTSSLFAHSSAKIVHEVCPVRDSRVQTGLRGSCGTELVLSSSAAGLSSCLCIGASSPSCWGHSKMPFSSTPIQKFVCGCSLYKPGEMCKQIAWAEVLRTRLEVCGAVNMKRWKEVILDTEIYIGKCLKVRFGHSCPGDALEMELQTAACSCLPLVGSGGAQLAGLGWHRAAPAALKSCTRADGEPQIAGRSHQGGESHRAILIGKDR